MIDVLCKILSATVHCLEMHDQWRFLLELLENTRIDWKSLDSSDIDICSSLLLFLPVLISNLQLIIAQHHRSSSSCTLQQHHCIGLLRQILEELVCHAVAIGYRLVTLKKHFGSFDLCVSMSTIFWHEQEQTLKSTLLWASVLVSFWQRVSPKPCSLPPGSAVLLSRICQHNLRFEP